MKKQKQKKKNKMEQRRDKKKGENIPNVLVALKRGDARLLPPSQQGSQPERTTETNEKTSTWFLKGILSISIVL